MALQNYKGEGMVAVVRGLPDSNLAVTLHDGKRTYTLQPDENYNRIHTTTSTYKAEISKEDWGKARRTITADAAAQANEDRFASSYQISHCKVRPTSPPVEPSEFPPQRLALSPGQGNFIVGALENQEFKTRIRGNTGSSCGKSNAVKANKRTINTPRSSRQIDSFANSLRKYPNESSSPERSTDLIERMINYTQTKFTTKDIRNTGYQNKSKESNFKNVIEDLKNSQFSTSSKNIQTYTRSHKPNINSQDTPTKDIIEKNKRNCTKTAKEANKNKVNKSVDKMDFVINNNMYSKCMDVRYLCDMTKCIRERIKQIIEDSNYNCGNNLCPKHRERLNQHRKDHHSRHSVSPTCDTSKRKNDQNTKYNEGATACLSEPLNLSTAEICSPSFIFKHSKGISITKSQSKEIDQKDLTLKCQSSDNTNIAQYSHNKNIEHSSSMGNIFEINKTAECYEQNILNAKSKSEEILPKHNITKSNEFHAKFRSWLLEVPVFQNESKENKLLRDEMIGDLEDKLLQLLEELDADELETQIRSETAKTLINLPMWHPQDGEDEVIFIDKIISNLISRIISTKDSFNTYSNRPIIVERSECKHKLCYDKFKTIIFKWVNNLPLKPKAGNRVIDRHEIVDRLDSRLRPLALKKTKCKSIYKYILRDNIKSILKELPLLSFCCSERDAYEQLALKLAEPLSLVILKNEIILPTSCCESKGSMKDKARVNSPNRDNLHKTIFDEIIDVLEHSHLKTNDNEREKTALDISNFLLINPDIMRGNEEETNVQISKFLQEISNVNLTQADDVANIIVDRIHEKSLLQDINEMSKLTDKSMLQEKSFRPEYVTSETTVYEKSIRDWAADLSLKFQESEDKINDLTERLAHIETHSNINESKRDAEIKHQGIEWLKDIQLKEPLKNTINEATDALVNKVKETRKNMSTLILETKEPTQNYISQIEEQVSQWFYELPVKTPMNIEQLNKDLVTFILRHKNSFESIQIETRKILDTLSMTPNFDKLKPNMVDKLIKRLKYKLSPTQKTNNEPYFNDNENREYIIQLEKEISNWCKKLPFELKSLENTNVLIKELATDIFDRNRYLESNPNKTLTSLQEINFLEYEIFKWLHKAANCEINGVNSNNKLFPYINELVNTIETIKMKRQETKRNLIFYDPVMKIQDEIIDWFNKLPNTLKSQLISNDNEKLAKELAENIVRCRHRSDKEKYEFIEYEVDEWLRNICINYQQTYELNEFITSLKERIKNVYKISTITDNNNEKHNRDVTTTNNKYGPSNTVDNDIKSQTYRQSYELSESHNTFIREVTAWCNDLPILSNDINRENIILTLVLQIFQRIWYLAANPIIFQNDTLLMQTLDQQIKTLLNDFPPSKDLEMNKDQITKTLIQKIIEHKNCFKKDPKQELYNYLMNWSHSVINYIPDLSDEIFQKLQTDLIYNIICKAFEITDDPYLCEDARLFQDLMCEEIETLIDKLPKTLQLQNNKHILALMLSNEIIKNKYVFIENRQQNLHDISNMVFYNNEDFRNFQDPEGYKSFESGVPASSSMTREIKRNNGIIGKTPTGTLQSLKEVTPEQPVISKPTNKSNLSHISQQNIPYYSTNGILQPNQRMMPEIMPSYSGNASPWQEPPTTQPKLNESKQLLLEEILSWCNELPFEDQYREALETEILFNILHKARTLSIEVDNGNFQNKMRQEIENILNNCPFPVKFDKHALALKLAKIIQLHKYCFRKIEKNNPQFISSQNAVHKSQFHESKQEPSDFNLKEHPNYDYFKRKTLTSSTPYRLFDNNKHMSISEPGQLENTNDQQYTSLYSTKQPTEINTKTAHKSQNYFNVSSSPSYLINDKELPVNSLCQKNLNQKQSSPQDNISKSQTEADSQTDISNINHTANLGAHSQSTLRNTIENRSSRTKSLLREQNPQNLQIPNNNFSRLPSSYGRLTVPSINIDQNLRRRTSNEAYMSGGVYDNTNITAKRSFDNDYRRPSIEGLVPDTFSTPTNQNLPNNSQGSCKRRLGLSAVEDNYDEIRLNELQRKESCYCRCERYKFCPRKKHGFCMRSSCLTCNSSTISEFNRCCGMHCPLPSCLYFQ